MQQNIGDGVYCHRIAVVSAPRPVQFCNLLAALLSFSKC